jgi:hypothetical protein
MFYLITNANLSVKKDKLRLLIYVQNAQKNHIIYILMKKKNIV